MATSVSHSPAVTEEARLIERQLNITRSQVRLVELGASLVAWLVGILVFLLTVVLIDHWIMPLGTIGRTVSLLLLIAGSATFFGLFIWPLLRRQINPVYAARTIEESTPSLKNSLINFLLLRSETSGTKEAILSAVERRAAMDIANVPVDLAVDRSHLIRLGYVLLGVLIALGLYKMRSPKDPFQTVARVFAPWANIAQPARVTIRNVTPGDVRIYHGETVTVSASIFGLREKEKVELSYSTTDGQVVDRRIEMAATGAETRFEAILPPPSSDRSAPHGIQQDLVYRVLAGDSVSTDYRVTVSAAPTIAVEKVVYHFPSYTGKPEAAILGQGDVQGLEGTLVTIHARANQPIESATLEFDPAEGGRSAETLKMEVAEKTAKMSFPLQLTPNRERPWRSAYQIRFYNKEGSRNPQPILHRIDVTADLPPEIEWLAPEKSKIEVPADGLVRLELRAVDPDYGLKAVRLHVQRGDQQILAEQLLATPQPQATTPYMFSPQKLHLEEGDEVVCWGVAEDGRMSPTRHAPEPNVTRTENIVIRITESSAKPNNPNEPKNDQPDKQPKKPNDPQQKPEDKPKPGENEQGRNDPPKPGEENKQENGNNQQPKNQGGNENKPQKNQPNPQANEQKQPQQGGNGNKNQPGAKQQGDEQEQPPMDGDQGNQNNGGGSAGNESSKDPRNSQSGNGGGQEASNNDNNAQPMNNGSNQGGDAQGKNGGQNGSSADGGQGNGRSASGDSSGNKNGGKNDSGNNAGQPSGNPNDADGNQGPAEKAHEGDAIDQLLKEIRDNPNHPAHKELKRLDKERADKQKQRSQGSNGQQSQNEGQNASNGQKPDGENSNNKNQVPNGQNNEGAGTKPEDKNSSQNGGDERQPNENQAQPGEGDQQGQPKNEGNGGDASKPNNKEAGPNDNLRAPNANDPKPPQNAGKNNNTSPNQGQGTSGNQNPNKSGKNNPDQPPETKNEGQNAKPGETPQEEGTSKKPGLEEKKHNDGNQQNATPGESGATQRNPRQTNEPKPNEKPTQPGEKKEPGTGDNGQSGAGANSEDKNSTAASGQGKNQDKPKNMTPDSNKPEKGEPSPPSNSKKQSDSKGGESGDQSGGGKEGDGQSAGQAGNNSAGKSSSADQGAGKSNEQGVGEQGDQAGNQEIADGQTGNSSDKKPGSGSKTSAGQKPGEKGPSDKPNPGSGKPDGQAGDASHVLGGGVPNGNNNRGVGVTDNGTVSDGDEANLEYARQTTDLVIDSLESQRHDPDPELLKKLGWTKEDMQQFMQRWKLLKEAGDASPEKKQELDESLRSLGLRPPKNNQRAGGAADDRNRDIRDTGGRTSPPNRYQDQFDAFRKGVGR